MFNQASTLTVHGKRTIGNIPPSAAGVAGCDNDLRALIDEERAEFDIVILGRRSPGSVRGGSTEHAARARSGTRRRTDLDRRANDDSRYPTVVAQLADFVWTLDELVGPLEERQTEFVKTQSNMCEPYKMSQDSDRSTTQPRMGSESEQSARGTLTAP